MWMPEAKTVRESRDGIISNVPKEAHPAPCNLLSTAPTKYSVIRDKMLAYMYVHVSWRQIGFSRVGPGCLRPCPPFRIDRLVP